MISSTALEAYTDSLCSIKKGPMLVSPIIMGMSASMKRRRKNCKKNEKLILFFLALSELRFKGSEIYLYQLGFISQENFHLYSHCIYFSYVSGS